MKKKNVLRPVEVRIFQFKEDVPKYVLIVTVIFEMQPSKFKISKHI